MMNAAIESKKSIADNLVFVAVINAFFWLLALVVSIAHLSGTACFERLLPVLVGGSFVAGVGIVVTWKQRNR